MAAQALGRIGSRGPLARLGRYEILGRLATGGMAEILLGRVLGPHGFERPVAIKRILPELAENRAFVEMFVDEARIAARIRHARVVQVHELAAQGGEYFLVMEYIEGENLGGLMRRMWLRSEALDRVLAAHIVAEACAGLHAAHELTDASGVARGVVHRDVSPQNVMITFAGEVKVLDFGIAKAFDSARTQDGHVKGKCEYMSPEQCIGASLDRRSDIFSLGILLYELTVGKRLFKRADPAASQRAVCSAPIPRPTEVDPTYPPILEAICARALARDRSDRYPTMLEMRRDLVAAIRQATRADQRAGEEEQLAGAMARLFADRIQDKRDMLRRARTEAAIVQIPVAEVDLQVELPEVPPPSTPGLEPTRRPLRFARPLRHRALIFTAGALVAAALGGAGRWIATSAAPPDPISPIASPLSARELMRRLARPVPVPMPLGSGEREPIAAAKPAMVSLTVESTPAGAEVFVDGQRRGNAPCWIELVRTDQALAVAVSRAGFKPIAERVVPNTDQKLLVHLQPLAARATPNRPARAPSGSPPPPPSTAFERFE